ncbi:carboxypeptidase-like regulatory domain-containing protein [Stieleria sp. TO1_6]|uniref:carboxypeptidase-like regulatory domain-containing protein n=1 Tax=Stieleria tagensis TaxID=2956795 RepID=UPI00209B0151|nr:carboxypeptidase-like regulatory domain-containing protein [Stieleria tagensis]MCO8121954.1 carboxypeptidase-like regulatory domain-containing protein [Stieleria tagensis]
MKRLICAAAALAMVVSSGFASAADVTEHQWVRASDNGSIMGRVIVPRGDSITAVRGAKVSLIDQFGKFAGVTTKSDKTGRFTISHVTPGVYTLMIQGDNAFACCAMHVLQPNVPISDQFEVAAGAVDYSVVRNAVVRYLPAGQPTAIVFDPSVNPLTSGRVEPGVSARVTQFEGGIKGRLTRAGFSDDMGAKDANVLIYHDGVEVARTVTDQEGNFVVGNLAPGSYSVLGSGKDGFGLMGLELVGALAETTAAKAGIQDTTLVAQAEAASETFVMQVAPLPSAATVIDDRVISEDQIGTAVPFEGTPGTSTGGGMSGGGGAGGGGGIGGGGRLLLLGGVGAGIAIALSDDDDSIEPPPVVSPVAP